MPESLGARLRQQRERRQITLPAIAEQTKIKLSLLEALERDDVSHWPAGIFRRAFIRAYAHAIGLEPDVVVREFLEIHPDPIEVVATVSAGTAMAPGADGGGVSTGPPPTRLRYFVGSAIQFFSRLRSVQSGRSTGEDVPAADRPAAKALNPPEADLLAAAHLCTELGRVDDTDKAAPLLDEVARILDAVGVIVWTWDARATELRPTLAHGYSDKVLAQLPRVTRDTDNATASAFRSAQTCIVHGSDLVSGAVVVPLMTSAGCVGVLAMELQHGNEQRGSVRALLTIFAAQLARVVGAERTAEAGDRRPA